MSAADPKRTTPRDERPLGRVHLRLAGVTVVLAGLGGGAIAVLAKGEFETPRQVETHGVPGGRALATDQPAPATPEASLAPEAPEPPGRSLEVDPELPPLATRWRKAVVLSQRDRVMAGARALQQAPDGKAQLLALMEDSNPRVRAFALRELGRRRDKSLEPELQRFLSDPDPYVVENARWALDTLEQLK